MRTILCLAMLTALSAMGDLVIENKSETDTLFYSLREPGTNWSAWNTIGPGDRKYFLPQGDRVIIKYFNGDETIERTLTNGERYLLRETTLYRAAPPPASAKGVAPAAYIQPVHQPRPVYHPQRWFRHR